MMQLSRQSAAINIEPQCTAAAVAEYMMQELQLDGVLYQEHAVQLITAKFGRSFLYENANGNLAISPRVLAAFRKVSAGSVTSARGERMWEKTA